jgi:hypothetical protein
MPMSHSLKRVAKTKETAEGRSASVIDTYEMSNLFPRTTGLLLTVWVSPRGRARHAARIKVSLTPGKMDAAHTAVVAIQPKPRLVEGKLSEADLALVSEWITLNEAALLEFWDETIDSVELGGRLKKLDRSSR